MKRKIYITLFVFLGFMVQLIIHAAVERYYINLLISNYDRYGFGLGWDQWFVIHHIYTAILLIGGVVFGYVSGRHWWHIIYADNK